MAKTVYRLAQVSSDKIFTLIILFDTSTKIEQKLYFFGELDMRKRPDANSKDPDERAYLCSLI